jgi:hypothetical protein
MKPYAARRRFAILLISVCAVPFAYALPPAQETGRYPPPMRGPSAPACDEGVLGSVIGVYGGTVVDQLSSGVVVLVTWPNGSPRERWSARSHGYWLPVDHATNAAHVFFLWPES